MTEHLRHPDSFEETFSIDNLAARISEQALLIRRQKARVHLKNSKFIKLCDELYASSEVQVENNLIKRDLTIQLRDDLSDESVFIEVLWGLEGDPLDLRQILIEAYPTGEIFVRGNAIGSTVLGPTQWASEQLKLKALEKARNNPYKII